MRASWSHLTGQAVSLVTTSQRIIVQSPSRRRRLPSRILVTGHAGHWGRLFVGSRAASFKRPLLSVDVSVCLSVSVCRSETLMLNNQIWYRYDPRHE